MVNGARLNGSFESDNRWDFIVARSRMVLDDGRQTGSRITVNINGSYGKIQVNTNQEKMEKNACLRTHLEVLPGLPLPPKLPWPPQPCLRRLATV